MILYADGCSLSLGTELFTDQYPEYAQHRNLVINCPRNLIELGYAELADYNLTHCYPALLAKELDYKLINSSVNGSGNELIAYRTQLNLSRLLETHAAEEIVALIGWTDMSRRFALSRHAMLNFCPPYVNFPYGQAHEQHYFRHITTHFEHELITGTLAYHNVVNGVLSFCRNNGIKVLMTHGLSYNSYQHESQMLVALESSFNGPYWQAYYEQYVDTQDFYLYQSQVHTNLKELISSQINGSFHNFADKNEYSFCPYGHPGTKAHEAWAQLLITELKKRSLV